MSRKSPEARREYYRAYIARRDAADPDYKRRRLASFANYKSAEAKAARERVRRAIIAGRLTRPDSCEECGASCKPHAAHIDYQRALDVRWLCVSCHRKFDVHGRTATTRKEPGPHNRDKTHCPRGHEYTPENTQPTRNGKSRRCAQCHRDGERRRRTAIS